MISWLRFEELDSTSLEAQRCVAKGTSLPFVVTAQKQTQGKGTFGKHWVSPAGNLYLTIVIAYPLEKTDVASFTTSLALVIRQTVGEVFHFFPLVKWPNDLYAGGKKLGGILCETSFEGMTQGPLLIGIGVNINHAPTTEHLAREEHRATTSVREMLNSDVEIDGAYFAERLVADILQFLRSKADGFRPTLLCEQGHSRIKWGLCVGSHLLGHGAATSVDDLKRELQNARGHLRPLLSPQDLQVLEDKKWPIHVLRTKKEEALMEVIKSSGFEPIEISERHLFITTSDYDEGQLGIDRKVQLEKAVEYLRERMGTKQKKAAMVLSLGTMTTIDFVSRDGHHYGGVIFPGIHSSLKAAHGDTGSLPLVDAEKHEGQMPRYFAHNTSEAIFYGVLLAHIAQIKEALRFFAEEKKLTSQEILIILSGGEAPFLQNYLNVQEEVLYEPHLTLLGAYLCQQEATTSLAKGL